MTKGCKHDSFYLQALFTQNYGFNPKEHVELKKTRYIWLKRKYKLSEEEEVKLASLKRLNLKTARAHAIIESLWEIWTAADKSEARFLLKKWYFWATPSRLEPIKEFAKTVRNHWEGILNVFDSYITNGIIEGLNNKIKTAMKRAIAAGQKVDQNHRFGRLPIFERAWRFSGLSCEDQGKKVGWVIA